MRQIKLYLISSMIVFTSCAILENRTHHNKIFKTMRNMFKTYVLNDQSFIGFVIQNDLYDYNVDIFKYIYKSVRTKTIVLNMKRYCDVSQFQGDPKLQSLGQLQLIFMFVEANITKINATLNCLENINFWKSRTKTILVTNETINKNETSDIFRLCWTKKILNIVAISSNSTITYNPFFQQFYEPVQDKEAFYAKFKNLNGYNVNILLIKPDDHVKVKLVMFKNETKYFGKDANSIQTILQNRNATYSVVNIQELIGWANPFRSTFRNSKYNEKLAIIKNYSIDLFFLSQEMMMNNNVTEMIYPHSKDDWMLLVPHAKFLSQYSRLFMIFKAGLAVILGFFLMVCPLVWFIIRIMEYHFHSNELSKLDSIIWIIINNLRVMLGSSVNLLTVYSTEYIFFMFVIFCNLIINTYVQSILYSILTIASREPEINTISDFINSDFRVKTVQNLYEDIKLNFQFTSLKGIISKVDAIDANGTIKTLTLKEYRRDTCVLLNKDRCDMLAMLRPFFRCNRESLIPAYVTFHVAKNSPFFDMMEKIIPWFQESGLYQQWHKHSLTMEYLIEGIIRDEEEFYGYQNLSLHQFRGAIYVFLIGLAFSMLVFMVEILVNYVKNK